MNISSSNTLTFSYEALPATSTLAVLTDGINNESVALGIKERAEPFAFFIKDQTENIIAGCNGSLIYGSLYIDQLWVHPNFRGQRLATQLMEQVHSFGLEHDCKMATVCTMSFQNVRSFYERLGYHVDFVRHGYASNASCYFMKKELL